jgi:hypothetical protein
MARATILILPLLAAAVLLAGCEKEFKLPIEEVTIADREPVFSAAAAGARIAFTADQDATFPAGTSYAFDLPVTLRVDALNARRVDVVERVWINEVIVTLADGEEVVFVVDEVQHRGLNLHLKLNGIDR